LHHRAEFLNGRDLYGELAKAAHEDGLVVLARMDSNRTAEDFFRAHPDWFARQKSGQPYREADKYVTCVNSPYYDEYLPGILQEIIERSHPEGFGDNSWSGLTRDRICYCENCTRKFKDKTGKSLPAAKDWNDHTYREWIEWNYARRVEIWDSNNRVTKAAGGPHCLWLGMNSGSISTQSRDFRDFREICKRSEFLLLDHQSRTDATGFQQNGDTGKLVHGLTGWDKIIIESMALYQVRVASKPEPEARMWMIEGIAGGIEPWWHMVGAYHDDRRMYHTPERIFHWQKDHEAYLIHRQPAATVGVVWSQKNTDYFGRDNASDLVDAPYRGFTEALLRARIPYLPVNAADIGKESDGMAVLVLPNVGALSDSQCQAVRQFVQRGGSLVASGASSLYDEWGDARKDFGLADLFGAHAPSTPFGREEPEQVHSYLRLLPEMRAKVWGPHTGDEPVVSGERHPVLKGFEETDIIPFGGVLTNLRLDPGTTVPLTFVPAFPVYPPETAWMRTPKTDIPGLVLNTPGNRRVAYMPADIDRRYARTNLPDHANLLANLVRWAAGGRIDLEVHGAGLIDCHMYRQPGRLILHLVNLSNEGTWRGPLDELIPIGPVQVRLKMPQDVHGRGAQFLVSDAKPSVGLSGGWATFEVKSIVDHEVVVLS
ncbi:MAG TPA: alpha-amylase family protein, partial [Bryobacteraceae bacterium]